MLFYWSRFSIGMSMLYLALIATALSFDLPSEKVDIVGEIQWMQALQGDTFHTIGRRYGIGYHEMVEANSGVSEKDIKVGTIIVVPSRFLLPSVARKGIVINLAELRLYHYDKTKVHTYPIGIGRTGWDTPIGLSYVLAKLKDPVWNVPKSIQEDSKKEGIFLPDKVLPGEDNPLGAYALRLHYHNYLIHGTNDAEGVGRRSTAGCIRMFPSDIQALFQNTSKGTWVNIINEPHKLGWDDQHRLYLESHLPLRKTNETGRVFEKRLKQCTGQSSKTEKVFIAQEVVHNIQKEMLGIPFIIGHTYHQ